MTSMAATADRRTAPLMTSWLIVARRALLRFVRTPQLIVVGTIQMALFMLIYRFMFGGAIDTGPIPYVDFLVPGFVTTGVLFTGIGTAVAMAQDLEEGFVDRLRSLPIARSAVLAARAIADTAILTWSLGVTVAIGFAVGFEPHGTVLQGLAAFGLVVLFGYAFVWVFIALGMFAGTAQAAQGMGMIVFPFAFISSAYVPVATMPGWLQAFAEHQPLTPMVDAVRSLTLGTPSSSAITTALLWAVAILLVFAPLAVAKYRRG